PVPKPITITAPTAPTVATTTTAATPTQDNNPVPEAVSPEPVVTFPVRVWKAVKKAHPFPV
ncbi:hypothetical protein HDU98_004969, partial [Podochytrium sp. JEL0797]